MNEYFDGSVAQLLERTRQLCDLIPRSLGRDVAALEVVCRDRLNEVGNRLRALKRPEMREGANQRERLRLFRRARGELDYLESVAVTALCRWNEEDRRVNRLADGLAREISYPLPTPVISCASQRYFHTYPDLRLVCVPLAEGRFLLHLPDLYHELGHSLLEFKNDRRLAGFQQKHVESVEEAVKYLLGELRKENTGLGPELFKRYLITWMDCWLSWAIEFFCDLYAVYMIGPAFVWAHLHLAACVGADPFRVPLLSSTVHPADGARMQMLLLALDRLSFHDERVAIECRWEEFLKLSRAQITPEYRRCFPGGLLSRIERLAFDGTVALECDLASTDMKGPGRLLLNEAWQFFWRSPDTYVDWERLAVNQLFQHVAP
ncbi:MAG: hypothetical protein ACE141_18060 [Bryobacteraceae bacterium]